MSLTVLPAPVVASTRRVRGKLPKVALIAAVHKLLLAIYSVAKHRRPFVPHLTVQGVQA